MDHLTPRNCRIRPLLFRHAPIARSVVRIPFAWSLVQKIFYATDLAIGTPYAKGKEKGLLKVLVPPTAFWDTRGRFNFIFQTIFVRSGRRGSSFRQSNPAGSASETI